MKILLFLPLALLVAACAEQSGPQYPKNRPEFREGNRGLDGPQSVELVVGNTVEGRYTATEGVFVDYFAPDGRFVSREPDGAIYRVRWKARYTEFCIEYDDHPHLAHQRCFSFWEKDGRYSSFRPGGAGFYDIDFITPGNVKNLPLE